MRAQWCTKEMGDMGLAAVATEDPRGPPHVNETLLSLWSHPPGPSSFFSTCFFLTLSMSYLIFLSSSSLSLL